jgi:hypothetical protein
MSMGNLFIFCSMWFLSSVVYSFSCRGLSHSLLIPRYLSFFEAIINIYIYIYFFSQPVHSWCIEKLLSFVNWCCILLLLWSCLWCLVVFWWHFSGLLGIRSFHLQLGIVWHLSLLFVFLLFLLPILLLWQGIPRLCWLRVESVDILVSFLT